MNGKTTSELSDQKLTKNPICHFCGKRRTDVVCAGCKKSLCWECGKMCTPWRLSTPSGAVCNRRCRPCYTEKVILGEEKLQ